MRDCDSPMIFVRLEPVARRRGQAVDVLIDHPVEEPLDQDQQRAGHLRCGALLGVDDLQHVELGDLADRSVAPCGDEDGAEVALGHLAAALLCQLVGDEGFRDVGERMLDAQRPLTGCLLAGFGLDHGGVDALGDQAAPFACGAPRFLQA